MKWRLNAIVMAKLIDLVPKITSEKFYVFKAEHRGCGDQLGMIDESKVFENLILQKVRVGGY